MENSQDLAGKNVILTGASRGLGAAIAEKMWMTGASLILVDRELEGLNEVVSRLGNRPRQIAHPFHIDLSTPDAVELIIKTAQDHFGHLDILINNAAIQGPVGPSWENDWNSWNLTIKIDLLAPINLSRYCAQWMIQQGKGKIICLSGGGATGSRPNFSAYAVAKTGLVRFCEILADELSPYNIQVNCIAPGVMSTAILDEVLSAGPERAGQKEYDSAIKIRQQGGTPPDRVAELVIFLASAASNRITGKLISAVWDPWEQFSKHIDDLQKSDVYTLRRITPKDRSMDWGDV
jgi:NAD(P)-dependent dehydrogenase (short-subunit alcohol dehydrogenase family)